MNKIQFEQGKKYKVYRTGDCPLKNYTYLKCVTHGKRVVTFSDQDGETLNLCVSTVPVVKRTVKEPEKKEIIGFPVVEVYDSQEMAVGDRLRVFAEEGYRKG